MAASLEHGCMSIRSFEVAARTCDLTGSTAMLGMVCTFR
jgi:hypothetical protein